MGFQGYTVEASSTEVRVGCSEEKINRVVVGVPCSLCCWHGPSLYWKKQGHGRMEQPFVPLPPNEDMPGPPTPSWRSSQPDIVLTTLGYFTMWVTFSFCTF